MKIKLTALLLFAALLAAVLPVQAQENLISLSFEDAPLEQAVELYREWTGRTIIKQADLSARITLKGRQLTQNEAKQAIETVLSMNGVALVPMGDKFLKVVPIANARQEGMEIKPFDPDQKYAAADQLITQVIPLRFVVFADVQPLIQHLVHGYGKIIEMARINSVLVTDTSANIARIVELVSMVDQPAEKIEPRIYQLKYAEAATVAGKLKELVEAAKTKKGEQTVVAGNVRTIPGVIRAPRAEAGTEPDTEKATEQTEMIVGEVKLVADDRTNVLIIFSKAANFGFFDDIIKVLDVPVDPAVIVEVVKLEYAKAKEISGILNDFVGAAKATEKTKAPGGDAGKAEGSKTVDEIIQRAIEPTGHEIDSNTKGAMGRLSADTKILSDERSNSLLLMGRRSDVEALKQVVANLDVMLAQVLLETVIIEVSLTDGFTSGVQWLYSTMSSNAISGATLGAGWLGSSTTSIVANAAGGLINIPRINSQAVVTLTKNSNNVKILSSPVVLTTDNKEAKITSGKQIPISATTYSGSGITSQSGTQYKDATLSLTITPHINPQHFVLMDIDYSESQAVPDASASSSASLGPTLSTRALNATIAVDDRSTVVLGGLVTTHDTKSHNGIPLLGDIPLIGKLFSQDGSSKDRSELVVLITPYVLTTPEEAKAITGRIHSSSDIKNVVWPTGWSASPLRNEEPKSTKDIEKKKKDEEKAKKEAAKETEASATADPAVAK